MKLFFLFFALLFSLIFSNAEAQKLSNKECVQVASAVTQEIGGTSLDEVTILNNAICVLGNFIYNYSISENITPKDFENRVKSELKPVAIRSFCTDPSTRPFLESVRSITFKYTRYDGVYLTEYSFNDSVC